MNNDLNEKVGKQSSERVLCPRCGKAHYSDCAIMDTFVDCGCGMRFYAFSNSGLQITIPSSEAGCEPIARAMRRFVVATGRCLDIPPELYQDESGQYYFGYNALETDAEEELERVLEQFQTEFFNDYYLTKDLIYSICENFQNGNDVELRKQKKGVDIIKLIKKRVPVPEKKRISSKAAPRNLYGGYAYQLMISESGILKKNQTEEQRPQ